MLIILRCILDIEDDVIRDLSIPSNFNLEQLHNTIRASFGLSDGEMATFIKTNNDWEQGEEIPLINMNDIKETKEMKDIKVSDLLVSKDDKLIYVYDFLNMWTFYIMVHDTKPSQSNQAIILNKIGKLPDSNNNLNLKKYNSIDLKNDFLNYFNLDDDFENSDSLDDLPEDFY